MNTTKTLFAILATTLFLIPGLARAELQCNLDFNLSSWSFFYQKGEGNGNILCNNGKRYPVTIKAHGGGITFGKSKITGYGNFTGAKSVDELFGTYAVAQAHAGMIKSARAEALTKGNISLTFSAKGQGYNVGFGFGGFTIKGIPVQHETEPTTPTNEQINDEIQETELSM